MLRKPIETRARGCIHIPYTHGFVPRARHQLAIVWFNNRRHRAGVADKCCNVCAFKLLRVLSNELADTALFDCVAKQPIECTSERCVHFFSSLFFPPAQENIMRASPKEPAFFGQAQQEVSAIVPNKQTHKVCAVFHRHRAVWNRGALIYFFLADAARNRGFTAVFAKASLRNCTELRSAAGLRVVDLTPTVFGTSHSGGFMFK